MTRTRILRLAATVVVLGTTTAVIALPRAAPPTEKAERFDELSAVVTPSLHGSVNIGVLIRYESGFVDRTKRLEVRRNGNTLTLSRVVRVATRTEAMIGIAHCVRGGFTLPTVPTGRLRWRSFVEPGHEVHATRYQPRAISRCRAVDVKVVE